MATGKRRRYAALPVHVAEDHHDVMWPVYRAMATRHLAEQGQVWLHIDSHPDLLLPPDFPPAAATDLTELRARLDIASFLLPAVFAGHIRTIVWLCVAGGLGCPHH